MNTRRLHRVIAALLTLISLWGIAGWWPRWGATAPDWTRLMPMPAALLSAALWWVFYARGRHVMRRVVMALVLAGLVAGFWQDTGGIARAPGDPAMPAFRIEQWTIHSRTPRAAILATLDKDSPHIRVLNVADNTIFDGEMLRRARLRGGVRSENIYIFSRYPMSKRDAPTLKDADALLVSFDTADGQIDLLALNAHKKLSAASIKTLAQWLGERDQRTPLILAGHEGLNTTDAAWQPVRKWLRPAFEEAGFGWPYSQSAPIALFSFDHLWVSRNLRVKASSYHSIPKARHRLQTASLALSGSP